MHYLYPDPVKPGDTIGLVTPSSPMIPGLLEIGVSYLQQKGFQIRLGEHVNAVDRFLAGDDEYRAKDLMDFFRDDEVKMIMAMGEDMDHSGCCPFWIMGLSVPGPNI